MYLTMCWWSGCPQYSPIMVLLDRYFFSSCSYSGVYLLFSTILKKHYAMAVANLYLGSVYYCRSLELLTTRETFLELALQQSSSLEYEIWQFYPLALRSFHT